MRRNFTAPPSDARCRWTIRLRDKSEAQCMRAATDGQLCTQHSRMRDRWHCEYCGGNDESPKDHTMDCTRPNRSTP